MCEFTQLWRGPQRWYSVLCSVLYSVYLLYKYKSTNTDGEAHLQAAAGKKIICKPSSAAFCRPPATLLRQAMQARKKNNKEKNSHMQALFGSILQDCRQRYCGRRCRRDSICTFVLVKQVNVSSKVSNVQALFGSILQGQQQCYCGRRCRRDSICTFVLASKRQKYLYFCTSK